MEWSIFLNYKNTSYKVIKIKQNANYSITLIPNNAYIFPSKILTSYEIGDQIEIEYDLLQEAINHFSVHDQTGQRHFRIKPDAEPKEITIGDKPGDINRPIPLISMIASANQGCTEIPSKGKWFGYNLPDDVNYLKLLIFAVPKNPSFRFEMLGPLIHNEKKTRESFDWKYIEQRNCNIAVFIFSTNHELTDLQKNIACILVEGKSIVFNRIEKGFIRGQVMDIKL